MDKICLIYQPVGNGDQWFLMKAARHYLNLGYQIVWPVVHEYIWMQDYVPEINWISWGDTENKLTHRDKLPDHIQFPYKDRYDPYAQCHFSDEFVYINGFLPPQGGVMESKYASIGLDWHNWQDYVIFDRNYTKENKLFYDVLELKDNEPYVFINRNYQLRPHILVYDRISLDTTKYDKKVVDMQVLPEYSVVDWLKVVERADEIHMIETSLNWLMESPLVRDNLTDNLNLYSRHNNFWQVRQFFNLPWNYILT